MKMFKYFLLILSMCFLSLVNISASDTNKVTSINNEGTIRTVYTFKRISNKWSLESKDVQSGTTSNGAFISKKHTLYSYSYDSSKSCLNVPAATEVNTCSKLTKVTSYYDATNSYPLKNIQYSDNKMTAQQKFIRDSKQRIKEYRTYTYYSNGTLKKFVRYYAGKNLKTDTVSYNKIYIQNKRSDNKIASKYYYENSQLWNAKKATVAKKIYKYYYYSNGKIQEVRLYNKSVKYNTYSKKQFTTYSKKGKKTKKVIGTFNKKGVITKKREYHYNKAGQLKSNKNGTAYRYNTSYKKGKVNNVVKYKYNSAGKAKKVK